MGVGGPSGGPTGAVEDLAELLLAEDLAKLDQGGEAEPAIDEILSDDGKPHDQARRHHAAKAELRLRPR